MLRTPKHLWHPQTPWRAASCAAILSHILCHLSQSPVQQLDPFTFAGLTLEQGSQMYQTTVTSVFPALSEGVHKHTDPKNCFLQICCPAVSQGPNFWPRTKKAHGKSSGSQSCWGTGPCLHFAKSHCRRWQLGVHGDLVTGSCSALSMDKPCSLTDLVFPCTYIKINNNNNNNNNTASFLHWHFLRSPVKAWVGKWRVFSKSDSGINLKINVKGRFLTHIISAENVNICDKKEKKKQQWLTQVLKD